MKYISKFVNDIDKDSFYWLYMREENSIYPPVIAKVDGKFYQLNNYNYENKDVFLKDFDTYEHALKFSTTLYNEINLVELSNIFKIAENFKCNMDEITIFHKLGVKGKRNFKILKKIALLPDQFKRYIVDKNISFKSISLFLKLKDNLKMIVMDYIKKESPSVGDFRKLLNFLYDYSRFIDISYYDKNYLENIRKNRNYQFYDLLSSLDTLQRHFDKKRVKILSLSNFENCEFELRIKFSNMEEIIKSIEEVKSNRNIFEKFFEELKNYDLC